MEGFGGPGGANLGSGNGQVELLPPGWDPMMESIRQLTDATAILRRIASALENRAPAQSISLYVPPGLADGTIAAVGHPQIRAQRIWVAPIGTGEPVLSIGNELIYLGSIQSVPVPIDFPIVRTIQVGVPVFLFDQSNPTVVPAFAAYIFGTTE